VLLLTFKYPTVDVNIEGGMKNEKKKFFNE